MNQDRVFVVCVFVICAVSVVFHFARGEDCMEFMDSSAMPSTHAPQELIPGITQTKDLISRIDRELTLQRRQGLSDEEYFALWAIFFRERIQTIEERNRDASLEKIPTQTRTD